jgi:hypothetical protein
MWQYHDTKEPQAYIPSDNRISRTVVGVVTLSGLVEQHAQTWFVERPTT